MLAEDRDGLGDGGLNVLGAQHDDVGIGDERDGAPTLVRFAVQHDRAGERYCHAAGGDDGVRRIQFGFAEGWFVDAQFAAVARRVFPRFR